VKKGAKKDAQVQNLHNILKFFMESCDDKKKIFHKKKEVMDRVERGVYCFLCKEEFEDDAYKVLPCFHQAHTNCLKQHLLKLPLEYPCTLCEENPISGEEETVNQFADNLFDKKYLAEFWEVKSVAIINKNLKHCGL
jgi:hypothetical protein